MAGTLSFDLVSPERRLASAEATEVQIPGAEGDMTAMLGHAPTITTLRPGVLRAVSASGTHAFAVIGGFAEISSGSVSVLAERAIALEGASAEALGAMIAEARSGAEAQSDRAAADKFLADLEALRGAVGA